MQARPCNFYSSLHLHQFSDLSIEVCMTSSFQVLLVGLRNRRSSLFTREVPSQFGWSQNIYYSFIMSLQFHHLLRFCLKFHAMFSVHALVYVSDIKYPFVSAFEAQKLRFQKSQPKNSVWLV